jgi:hypothetical protein
MSDRLRELGERQQRLQERCAAQRRAVAHEAEAIEARFESVDRMAGFARATVLHPVVIVGAVVGLLVLGRARGMQLIGRIMLLSTAARRVLRFAKHL